jgi:mannosyltransferase OCH1-like enzyme
MEKTLHQIWVGPYEIPDKEKYFLERNKELNPDFKHILWTDSNLPELPEKIQELCNYFRDKKDYAFVADVLRIFLVYEYGGLYIDLDCRPNYPLNELELERYNGFLAHHEEFNVPNGFFGCSRKSSYIAHLYKLMLDSKLGDHFFPYWFNKGVREYYNVEDLPESEYWPVLTEKCRVIGSQLLNKWEGDNIKYLHINREFSKYFEHFALHSWDSRHKKYFEDGDINYCDTLYKLNYK